MRNLTLLLFCCFTFLWMQSQVTPTPPVTSDSTAIKQPTKSPFNTGFYPLYFFDIDRRYLIKYNNYEGIRLGFGGITNDRLFENYKIGGYLARGFKDQRYKYSLGGNVKIHDASNSWLSLYYVNDIKEIGSFTHLTDARVYSVFEPRLVNITQFYKYREWQLNLQNELSDKVISEFRLNRTRITRPALLLLLLAVTMTGAQVMNASCACLFHRDMPA